MSERGSDFERREIGRTRSEILREARWQSRRRRRRKAIIISLVILIIVLLGVSGLIIHYALRDTEPPEYTVVIPEGLTVEETAGKVQEQSPISASEFMDATTTGDYEFSLSQDAGSNLEGFLFPKTYTFTDETLPHDAVQAMLKQFDIETENLDWSAVDSLGITRYQAMIIASLIEEEARFEDERPLVSSVVYNRLRMGMKLQIDATVQYALDERKEQLTYEDLEIDSPYNTYRVEGLPPAPICSPGITSIIAAISPAETDYLYYLVTTPEGRHSFTSDYQEFLRWKGEGE